MSTSSSVYNYLIKKYIEIDLLDKNENKIIKKSWDPFIYPDSGHIPPCNVCKNSYDEYIKQYENGTKISHLSWTHLRFRCLWSEYFENKIKQVNPDIKFKEK